MLTLKIPRYFEVLISIHCIPGLVAEAFYPDLGVYTPDELARIRYDFANRFYAEIEEASMNGSMRIRNRVGRVIDPKNFRNPGDVHTDWSTVAPHDLIDYLKDLDPVIVFIEPPANTATQPASDAHKQSSTTAEPVPVWIVNRPQRYGGYTAPLHAMLTAAHREGKQCPTARDVVEAWRINKPLEITQVLADGFNYCDSEGNGKAADLAAIHAVIKRMTSSRQAHDKHAKLTVETTSSP